MKNNKKKNPNGTNKTIMIIITVALIVIIGIIFTGGKKSVSVGTLEIKDGIQYVRITASGGYSPQVTEAKAGIETKIIVKTNGTYDCSASLVIPSIKFQKILPQTGETEIDIGVKKTGEILKGICGMGMYSFEINFS